MPDFPAIGCHAVAQYPSSYEIHAPVTVQRYVDGSEQRFIDAASVTRSWVIRLEFLSEEDASRIWQFFESTQGRAREFRFLDPWAQRWHEKCWFESDSLGFEHLSDGVFQGEIEIHSTEV